MAIIDMSCTFLATFCSLLVVVIFSSISTKCARFAHYVQYTVVIVGNRSLLLMTLLLRYRRVCLEGNNLYYYAPLHSMQSS